MRVAIEARISHLVPSGGYRPGEAGIPMAVAMHPLEREGFELCVPHTIASARLVHMQRELGGNSGAIPLGRPKIQAIQTIAH